jgi:hypothetical protein
LNLSGGQRQFLASDALHAAVAQASRRQDRCNTGWDAS